jgi:hypothetical protein
VTIGVLVKKSPVWPDVGIKERLWIDCINPTGCKIAGVVCKESRRQGSAFF